MQRILVIGCPGSGKSSFARRLRDKTGLPLIYLDMIWHRPDKTNVSREAFDGELNRVLRGERWIIDGNYMRTLAARLEKCDGVFLFDLPIADCLEGAARRVGTRREDLPWVEEDFDEEFRRYILDFPKDQLPAIYETLEAYPRVTKRIFHVRAEADAYIAAL